jgi:hypothetical protein
MYAIAWDGYITLEGRKWDAILVEAGEAQEPRGVLFAQRYQAGAKKLFRRSKNERVGNAALIDYLPLASPPPSNSGLQPTTPAALMPFELVRSWRRGPRG